MSVSPEHPSTPPLDARHSGSSTPDVLLRLLRHPPPHSPSQPHLSIEDLRCAVYSGGKQKSASTGATPVTLDFRLAATVNKTINGRQELDVDDRSPNSSVTLETVTPSSTPETDIPCVPQHATISGLESSLELYEPSSRELPWVEDHVKSITRPESAAKSLRSAADFSFQTSSQDSSLKSVDKESLSQLEEEKLPDTPIISPREENSDDEELHSLRAAASASLALMRSKRFEVKGILKTPNNTQCSSQDEYSTWESFSPSFSQSLVSTNNTPISSTPQLHSDFIQNTPTSQPEASQTLSQISKKMVRWQLDAEQEKREALKAQMNLSSPKIHRGNRIIISDDADDELMSVCSDDGPTPPLSPNAEAHFAWNESSLPNILSGLNSSPGSSTAQANSDGKAPLTSSLLRSLSPRLRAPPSSSLHRIGQNSSKVSLGAQPVISKLGSLPPSPHRTSSLSRDLSSVSLPLLQRSKSHTFGNTTNLRTNTRANALIGTQFDPITPHTASDTVKALIPPSLSRPNSTLPRKSQTGIQRAGSDATASLALRNSKKRAREFTSEDEDWEDARLGGLPPSKVVKKEA